MASEMKIELRQISASTSEATIGRHQVLIDRPVAKGGSDAGPMGGELFLAAVGGCLMSNLLAAIKAREADIGDVRVEVVAALADSPARFAAVELRVAAESGDRPSPQRRGQRNSSLANNSTNSLSKPQTQSPWSPTSRRSTPRSASLWSHGGLSNPKPPPPVRMSRLTGRPSSALNRSGPRNPLPLSPRMKPRSRSRPSPSTNRSIRRLLSTLRSALARRHRTPSPARFHPRPTRSIRGTVRIPRRSTLGSTKFCRRTRISRGTHEQYPTNAEDAVQVA